MQHASVSCFGAYYTVLQNPMDLKFVTRVKPIDSFSARWDSIVERVLAAAPQNQSTPSLSSPSNASSSRECSDPLLLRLRVRFCVAHPSMSDAPLVLDFKTNACFRVPSLLLLPCIVDACAKTLADRHVCRHFLAHFSVFRFACFEVLAPAVQPHSSKTSPTFCHRPTLRP